MERSPISTKSFKTFQSRSQLKTNLLLCMFWLSSTYILSLPTALPKLLQAYLGEEEIEHKCKCGGDTAKLTKTLTTLPRILVLHLKRFRHSMVSVSKIKRTVHIPSELNLSKAQEFTSNFQNVLFCPILYTLHQSLTYLKSNDQKRILLKKASHEELVI